MSYHKTGTKIRWLFFVETLHLVVHVFQYFFIDLLKTPFCKRCWKVFQTMQPCRVVIELKITAYDWSMDERFTIHHLLSKKKLEFQRVRTVRFKPYKYILKRARYIATHVPKKTDVLASANKEKCTVHSLTYSIHVLKMLATIFILFICIKCYDKIPSITGPRKLCQCSALLLPAACVMNWTLKGIRNSVIVPEGSRFIANFNRANTLSSQWKVKEMTKESSWFQLKINKNQKRGDRLVFPGERKSVKIMQVCRVEQNRKYLQTSEQM